MHGKTKSFLEDTTIVLVLAVAIGGAYFIYDKFFEKNDSEKFVEKIQKIIPVEINTTNSIILPSEKIEEIKEIEKPLDTQIELSIPEKIKPPKNTEIPQKETQIDRKRLKTFLEDVKVDIKNNIVQANDENNTESTQGLRFRITILKDGNYEQLTFVNGNEELFNANQENILKIFPLSIDNTIEEAFPRYIRFTIK